MAARKGCDYHCNGVVSALDSDRFSGGKAHACIYSMVLPKGYRKKKKKNFGVKFISST